MGHALHDDTDEPLTSVLCSAAISAVESSWFSTLELWITEYNLFDLTNAPNPDVKVATTFVHTLALLYSSLMLLDSNATVLLAHSLIGSHSFEAMYSYEYNPVKHPEIANITFDKSAMGFAASLLHRASSGRSHAAALKPLRKLDSDVNGWIWSDGPGGVSDSVGVLLNIGASPSPALNVSAVWPSKAAVTRFTTPDMWKLRLTEAEIDAEREVVASATLSPTLFGSSNHVSDRAACAGACRGSPKAGYGPKLVAGQLRYGDWYSSDLRARQRFLASSVCKGVDRLWFSLTSV